jgi:hypothetical protein
MTDSVFDAILGKWKQLMQIIEAKGYPNAINYSELKREADEFGVLLLNAESSIQKQAKTALKIDLDFPPNLPDERFLNYANTLWVRLDAVTSKKKET